MWYPLYFIGVGLLLIVFRMNYKFKQFDTFLNYYYNITPIIVAIGSILLGLYYLIKLLIQ